MNAERKSRVNELLGIARAHRQSGDASAALAAFEAAAEIDAGNRAIEVEVVHELGQLNRFEEADARLSQILAREPSNLPALVEAGRLANRRGRYADAVAAFQGAALVSPAHAGIQIEIARNLRFDNRPVEAEAVLGRLLGGETPSASALIELGLCRRLRGDHAGALSAFEEAGAADPSRPGPRLEAASEFHALGRTGEAEDVLRALIAEMPQTTAAIVKLAYFVLKAGRLEEADALFAEASRAEPRNPHHPLTRGRIALRRGDKAAAMKHFEAAVRVAPGNLDARLALAGELRERGRLDEAATLLREAPGGAVEAPLVSLELARILRAGNDRKGAASAVEKAAAGPADAATLAALAREKWALGDPAGARALLDRALAADPAHYGALLAAGEFAALGEDPEGALKHAEQAIAARPDDLRAYLLAARAAAGLLQRDRAAGLLGEAQSRFGDLPELLATRIHILRLFRDFGAARDAMAGTDDKAAANPSVWGEAVSTALATGDLAGAEARLGAPPPSAEPARVSFFKGRLAEARRDYKAAIAGYREALGLRPGQAEWHGDLARASLLDLDIDAATEHLGKSVDLAASGKLASGRNLNPSQSFVGRLLDEFRLDPAALEALRATQAAPVRERPEALRAVVRAYPDSTAAALLLLLALRRAGKLRYAPGRMSRLMLSRIPKRIVQFWDADVPPADVRELMATWDDPEGGFRHLVFHDENALAFINANCPAEVSRGFRRADHPAKRADIFRLAYLAREGGYYVDADDRRAGAFEDLAPKGATFLGYQEDCGTLANNFLAAIPGHPVIRRALDLAVAAVNRGDSDTVWLATGPGLMTRAFAAVASEPRHGSWQERASIRELHEMQMLVGIHCPAAYKRTERHWSRAGRMRRDAVPQSRLKSSGER